MAYNYFISKLTNKNINEEYLNIINVIKDEDLILNNIGLSYSNIMYSFDNKSKIPNYKSLNCVFYDKNICKLNLENYFTSFYDKIDNNNNNNSNNNYYSNINYNKKTFYIELNTSSIYYFNLFETFNISNYIPKIMSLLSNSSTNIKEDNYYLYGFRNLNINSKGYLISFIYDNYIHFSVIDSPECKSKNISINNLSINSKFYNVRFSMLNNISYIKSSVNNYVSSILKLNKNEYIENYLNNNSILTIYNCYFHPVIDDIVSLSTSLGVIILKLIISFNKETNNLDIYNINLIRFVKLSNHKSSKYSKDGNLIISLYNNGKTLCIIDTINKYSIKSTLNVVTDILENISVPNLNNSDPLVSNDFFVAYSKKSLLIVNMMNFEYEELTKFSGDIKKVKCNNNYIFVLTNNIKGLLYVYIKTEYCVKILTSFSYNYEVQNNITEKLFVPIKSVFCFNFNQYYVSNIKINSNFDKLIINYSSHNTCNSGFSLMFNIIMNSKNYGCIDFCLIGSVLNTNNIAKNDNKKFNNNLDKDIQNKAYYSLNDTTLFNFGYSIYRNEEFIISYSNKIKRVFYHSILEVDK